MNAVLIGGLIVTNCQLTTLLHTTMRDKSLYLRRQLSNLSSVSQTSDWSIFAFRC